MKKYTLKYIAEDIPKEIEEKLNREVVKRCEEDPYFIDEKWSDRIRTVYEEMYGKDEDAHDVYFTSD